MSGQSKMITGMDKHVECFELELQFEENHHVGQAYAQDENRGIEIRGPRPGEILVRRNGVLHIRTAPVPINRPRRMTYPFGCEEDGFYVGSYRDLKRYDLLRADQSRNLLRSYAEVYRMFYDRVRDLRAKKIDLKKKLILLIADDSCCFYFDEKTVTLVAEPDLIGMDLMLDFIVGEEEVDLVVPPVHQRKIINYEDTVRGRHRRSGNESVHPKDLTSYRSRAVRLFPIERDYFFDESGYQSDAEDDDFFPDVAHPLYDQALPFMMARQRALRETQELEEELRKGREMDKELVNMLLRQYFQPINNDDDEE